MNVASSVTGMTIAGGKYSISMSAAGIVMFVFGSKEASMNESDDRTMNDSICFLWCGWLVMVS